jgi:alpha-mannosidase
MHDIVSGTALARGYEYAWNDELLAANQFEGVLTDAVGVVASQMSTRAEATPLVLVNPLSIEREDVVEAEIPGDANSAASVRVTGPDGKSVPAQVLGAGASGVRIAFLAKMPSVGFSVFDARLEAGDAPAASPLRVDERRLENARWVVTLNDDGDIASIRDKQASRELLASPARLGLHYENPRQWPAWNQDWADRQLPAKEFVGGPARFRVVERGPARVAVEVARDCGASTFVQRIRLAAGGAGDRIEIDSDVAWSTRERSLRAAFPLTVKNPLATYDCQTGVTERGNAHEKQFEYGFQQWFDLTDASGGYGVTVMSDSKFGSDKPDDSTVRLTLLHTPGTRGGYPDQATQDLGRHRNLYALSGHEGDWRRGKSAQEAARLNAPILAFRTTSHDGPLGKSFSLLRTSDDDVRVTALKKAEDSDEIVVRLRELSGREKKGVHVAAARPIVAARRVDGQEREIGKAEISSGELVTDVRGYELRAFAIRLGEPPARASGTTSTPLDLAFDSDVASTNAKRGDGAMDADGRTFPAEQLPATIVCGGTRFRLGSVADGAKNALACRGQSIALPHEAGVDKRLELLLASAGDGRDVETSLQIDGKPMPLRVRDWRGRVGQWDHRLWPAEDSEPDAPGAHGLAGIEPGFVAPGDIAWFASHHHTRDGDAVYEYCYLYRVSIDLPEGAKSVRLPSDERVKLFAASLAIRVEPRTSPAAPLFDTLEDHVQDAPCIVPGSGSFADTLAISIEPRLYWRDGNIRYTLDGSDPTPSSATYRSPFFLDRAATVKSAVVDGSGRLGPVASARLDVRDVTPPTVERVTPGYRSPIVRIRFSEPVDDSAIAASSYALDPAIAVASVARDGERDVTLTLSSAPELDRAYRMRISGVKDASPAHNALAPATLDLAVHGPVFQLAEVSREQLGTEIRDVAKLPVKASDAWTLNLWVRTDKELEERTLIAGFGRCEQADAGGARYLARFSSGVHFWSHNRDVRSETPLDVGKWQMLTATYDGRTARLYKDAKEIGHRDVTLADDESVVRIAPLDPWDRRRRFDGEIRGLTIWSEALGEDALRSLMSAAGDR